MASIKVRQNGPYLVEGDDVTLVDIKNTRSIDSVWIAGNRIER